LFSKAFIGLPCPKKIAGCMSGMGAFLLLSLWRAGYLHLGRYIGHAVKGWSVVATGQQGLSEEELFELEHRQARS
jgi:hypothetical protein